MTMIDDDDDNDDDGGGKYRPGIASKRSVVRAQSWTSDAIVVGSNSQTVTKY